MPSLASLRIVDPVLTGLVQGYSNDAYVADAIFPVVDVDKEAGKIPVLTKEHFRIHNMKRAVGADSNVAVLEMLDSPIPFSLEEFDFGVPIDYRQAQESSLPIEAHAASVVAEAMMLRRELAVGTLLQNNALYTSGNTSSPAAKWSATTGTPLSDLRSAIANVRTRIGRKPNTVLIALNAWEAMIDNAQFTDRVKYIGGFVTEEAVAKLLGVDTVVIGGAVYTSDAMTTMVPVWNETAVIAHVTPGVRAQRNPMIPAFGYTLVKRGWPVADKYLKEGNKVTVVRSTSIEDQLFHGQVAGYLLDNLLA